MVNVVYAQELTRHWRLPVYDFTEPQAAFCKLFQCQNRRFRVFEAGYLMDFKN
jgi:hypothetical protein